MPPERTLRPAHVLLPASLWMATVGNAPLWRELTAMGLLQGRPGWLLALALAALVGTTVYAVGSLLAWPALLKPVLVLLLVATALAGYAMWTWHVVIDPGMATNALQTDWRELRELLSAPLAAALAAGALLPAWLVWRTPLAFRRWHHQAARNVLGAGAALALGIGLALVAFQPLASSMRNHKHLRYLLNPLNVVYAGGQALAGGPRAPRSLQPVGTDARIAPGGRPPLLVVVVGETGRSGNFGLNGYERDTTPELARAGVASFTNAWSCGTSTAASVPCMFSPLGRSAFLDRAQDTENLLDVLRHAGLAVLWVDNQGGCKSVCERVPNVSTAGTQDPVLCPDGECLDGVLLRDLDRRLAALPAAGRARGVVLVLHPIGSHGPAYAARSPAAFKRFLPECTSSHLPDCDVQAIRNAYDNSIAYTDHWLAETIGWLGRQNGYATGLLYVADHGESLGENNLYLHGLPHALAPDVQKHVPWISWLSPDLEQRTGLSVACLRRHAGDRISHDHFFHAVLGLLGVQTRAYQRDLDPYAPCSGSGTQRAG